MSRLAVVLVTVVVTVTLLGGGARLAALPGKNGEIAFTDRRDGDAEIYTISPGGSRLSKLTSNAADDFSPAFSPDGEKIAFTSDRAGDCSLGDCVPDIYVMDADGSEQTRLTRGGASSPAFSPNGEKIAFSRFDGTDEEILVMNADGSDLVGVTSNGSAVNDTQPAFSPDGERIVFVRDGDIYSTDTTGTGETRLTEEPSYETSPDWSPGGERIAFDAGGDIYAIDADGSNRTLLVGGPDEEYFPSYSPDGERISYTSRAASTGIYVTNSDGSGEPRRISDGADPSWGALPAPTTPACTIKGTGGADVLRGSRRADIVCGLGGDDALRGAEGRDTLRGGRGDDDLRGEGGGDTLNGGSGGDAMFGDSGGDRLRGTDGVHNNDSLLGGAGTDLCRADGRDVLLGCP